MHREDINVLLIFSAYTLVVFGAGWLVGWIVRGLS